MSEIILAQCQGCGHTYNELNGNTFKCPVCGSTNIVDKRFASNPKDDAKHIIEALREEGIIDKKETVHKQTQNATHRASEPRKKSVVGRVFLTIGIVYTVLCVISYLITAIAAVIPTITDSAETTKYTTTVVNINNGGEENDSGPEGTGSTRPIETTEFVPNEVLLVNLKPYDTRMPYTKTTSVADIFDHEYANGIYSHVERTDGPCSCTYRIDGNYDRFTFTSGIVEFGRGDPGEALIKVYADGKVIYERTLDCTSDSSFADLDVRGVKDLTLELYGHSEPEVSIRGATALYPCIWEATLYSAR